MSRSASPSLAPLAAANRPSIFHRIVEAMVESRRRAAERELRRHGYAMEPSVADHDRSRAPLAPRFGR